MKDRRFSHLHGQMNSDWAEGRVPGGVVVPASQIHVDEPPILTPSEALEQGLVDTGMILARMGWKPYRVQNWIAMGWLQAVAFRHPKGRIGLYAPENVRQCIVEHGHPGELERWDG